MFCPERIAKQSGPKNVKYRKEKELQTNDDCTQKSVERANERTNY